MKKELVKKHLEEKGSITSWEAIMNYGATRLADIIFKLRNEGMNIETVTVHQIDRYGSHTTYARYELKKGEDNGSNQSKQNE